MSVGYRRSANDASHRGPDGDSEVDGVNPSARGGSMSTDWIYEPLPARAGREREQFGPALGPTGARRGRRCDCRRGGDRRGLATTIADGST